MSEKNFQKFGFTKEQVSSYLKNAFHDLEIAGKSDLAEVKFNYSYTALIKSGIASIASRGLKVKSMPGHHISIIDKMSELLKNGEIQSIGNIMRMKRNADLYEGGTFISEKEAVDFYNFTEKILHDTEKYISKINI
jgi:hypothetical protein